MSIAQEKFDKDYRSMRLAVTLGVFTKKDMRDWIWIRGNQTALAAELEMNEAVQSRAKEMAERELRHDITQMWGEQKWGPERYKDDE